jgi:hypothetical protein
MLRPRHFFVQGALFVGALAAWAAGGISAFEDIAVASGAALVDFLLARVLGRVGGLGLS